MYASQLVFNTHGHTNYQFNRAHTLSKKCFFKKKPQQYFGKVCKWKDQCHVCIGKAFLDYNNAYPLHTNLSFFLVTYPFSFNLFMKTHFLLIKFFYLGLGNNSQVSFFSILSNYSSMASIHNSSLLASSKLFGSIEYKSSRCICFITLNCTTHAYLASCQFISLHCQNIC
jgi:hypothetical protein